jgi:uncharacterized protein YbcI
MAADISDGLVRLHKRYYGKGPTKAKTYIVEDTVLCLLRDGLTTIEETLISEGREAPVWEMRRSFQRVMEENFRAIVEEATGRRTIAYMSQVHTDPVISLEVFSLEPGPWPFDDSDDAAERSLPPGEEPR